MGNNSSSHQAAVVQLIGQSTGSDPSSSISTATKEWSVGLVFPISYLEGGFNSR